VKWIPAFLALTAFVSAPWHEAAGQVRFSDENVAKAIRKGVASLWRRQRGDGSWADPGHMGLRILGNDRQVGATGLVAYALLVSGEKVRKPKMVKALEWLDKQKTGWTYAVSLRAQAWMEAARQDTKYRRRLFQDARTLIRAAFAGRKPHGSYGYRLDLRGDSKLEDHDPSNGQYGVLGVWAAYQLNGEVPRAYWQGVLRYWAQRQEGDGGWKYNSGDRSSTGTMTGAGLATLFVCVDAAMGSRFVRCQRADEIGQIRRALDWFDRNFARTLRDQGLCHGGHGDPYYYLFGVERVGLASGYKYFGKTDWYKVGATWLLNQQEGSGAWKGRWGPDVATAYALLFLARGRHAVLFNRLEYDGDWNNRPRALANFCRWARNTFERTVYWQIINLRVNLDEWHDAPILVISGSVAPKFKNEHLDRLRRYVWQGGTIFSATECGGAGFRTGIREVHQKLFPKYELKEVPEGHDLYKLQGPNRSRAKFLVLSNGVRPLAIHTDDDLILDWQLNRRLTGAPSFQAASAVALYVTGKQLRPRGTAHWPRRPGRVDGPTVRLARLRHEGNYDPEPLAWERIARKLAADVKVKLEATGPIPIDQLKGSGAAVAALTGTSELRLTGTEKSALRNFVNAGGLVVVDAAGGIGGAGLAFARSATDVLREMFGRTNLRTLSSQAEIYQLKGHRIDRFRYRRKTRLRLGGSSPQLKGVLIGERIGVLFSREDLTTALAGCSPLGCDGYTPQTAYEIARNVALYAAGRRRK
jgi:hypothetical protein